MSAKKSPAKKAAKKRLTHSEKLKRELYNAKRREQRAAKFNTEATPNTPTINSTEVIAGKVIKSLPDQKGRVVDMVQVSADKYQVIKSRTGYASEELSLDEAEKVFVYQRLNPHSK